MDCGIDTHEIKRYTVAKLNMMQNDYSGAAIIFDILTSMHAGFISKKPTENF